MLLCLYLCAHNLALHVSISLRTNTDKKVVAVYQCFFFYYIYLLSFILENHHQEVSIINEYMIKNGLVVLYIYTWERSHAANIDEV
jgi:hypothetical protein